MQGRSPFNSLYGLLGLGQTTSSPNENESNDVENTYTDEEIRQAHEAALQVGPRHYQFTNLHSPDDICWMGIGCWGVPGQDPEKVAELMDKIIVQGLVKNEKGEPLIPDIVFGAGDYFYDNGVSTPRDPRFITQFRERYFNEKLTGLRNVPFILGLGNHDENREKRSNTEQIVISRPMGREVAINQIIYTYLNQPREFYEGKEFNLEKAPPHNMPYFFTSGYSDNVDFIVLNSNSYVKSFLKHLRAELNGEKTKGINQAAWVKEKYLAAKAENKKIIFIQHHPFFCSGKRAYPYGWDGRLYLNSMQMKQADLIVQLLRQLKAEKQKLSAAGEDEKWVECTVNIEKIQSLMKKILNARDERKLLEIEGLPAFSELYYPTSYFPPAQENCDYNYLFREIALYYEEIIPDIAIVAHEHYLDLSYHDIVVNGETHLVCQAKTGGGGSRDKLQEKLFFAQPENEACYFEKTGVFVFHTNRKNPENIYIHIFTTEGDHLVFSHKSKEPLLLPTLENRSKLSESREESLRLSIVAACDNYERFLDGQQKKPVNVGKYHGEFFSTISFKRNFTHRHNEVLCMHAIKNAFNSPEPLDFATMIIFLYERLAAITYPESTHSLAVYINEELKKSFQGKTLDALYKEALDFTPCLSEVYKESSLKLSK